MAAFPGVPETHRRERGTLSIAFLILSAILCGLGLFGVAYWLITLNWAWFASLIPLAIGTFMLFTHGTGPDRA